MQPQPFHVLQSSPNCGWSFGGPSACLPWLGSATKRTGHLQKVADGISGPEFFNQTTAISHRLTAVFSSDCHPRAHTDNTSPSFHPSLRPRSFLISFPRRVFGRSCAELRPTSFSPRLDSSSIDLSPSDASSRRPRALIAGQHGDELAHQVHGAAAAV
jgi:hypothetical protein